jgi:hypothetical protein
MKTKPGLYIGLIILILCGCKTAKYLPQSEAIDINEYGSFINVSLTNKKTINGELLSVKDGILTVLTDSATNKKAVTIPVILVKKFYLLYARPKNYGWTIPVYAASTLLPFPDPAGDDFMPFHGFFALLTVPINLIVTSTVVRNSFRYNNASITYEQLKMFARFPQGIPANINITSIK